jgi:cyanobactin maturation PatA/PatG family protease
LGISQDSVEENAAFAEKYGLPCPLLSDTSGEVCRAYGACSGSLPIRTNRKTFVIGPGGVIQMIYEDVPPAELADAVLEYLKEVSEISQKETLSPSQTAPDVSLYNSTTTLRKGEDANMSVQETDLENNEGQKGPGSRPQPDLEDASPGPEMVRAAQPELSSETAPASSKSAGTAPQQMSSPMPAHVHPSQNGSGIQLVYALGTLGYDFGTEARRDSLLQHMEGKNLLEYLEDDLSQAASLIWTLNLDATPIYAVQPQGAFAALAYGRIVQFLGEQHTDGVERVSIPGVIVGKVRLLSGQVVPVIWPELRGMYSWSTAALLEAISGSPAEEPRTEANDQAQNSSAVDRAAYDASTQAVKGFLERVYFELRNLGTTPQERAINYAATNALNVASIFEAALKEDLELDTIEVERSPICREDSDCWDVKLTFFNPSKVFEQARKVYRFTVDVSDVVPVMVGPVRSWSVR